MRGRVPALVVLMLVFVVGPMALGIGLGWLWANALKAPAASHE